MPVGKASYLASAGRAFEQAGLDEKRLKDLFNGIRLFANGHGKRVESYRPAVVFLDERMEYLLIDKIESQLIDIEPVEGLFHHRLGNRSVAVNLGKVTGPAQIPVCETRGTAWAGTYLMARLRIKSCF